MGSMNFREKIVESVKDSVPKCTIARRFGVHRATVKRYCKLLDERDTRLPARHRSWTKRPRSRS
jgi:transposase-like protein